MITSIIVQRLCDPASSIVKLHGSRPISSFNLSSKNSQHPCKQKTSNRFVTNNSTKADMCRYSIKKSTSHDFHVYCRTQYVSKLKIYTVKKIEIIAIHTVESTKNGAGQGVIINISLPQ